MFFVAGITGHVGRAAARHLLEHGQTVRGLVRDPIKAAYWSEKGVDVRQGDFKDPHALAEALAGVEGAYLMLPPFFIPGVDFAEATEMIASLRKALQEATPPRVVLLSSIGSQQTSGLGMITATHKLETALSDLPFPIAFVRAGSFLENYAFGLQAAAASGWFDTYLTPTDRAVPMIATEDIGREVARLLMAGWEGRKTIELGSPVTPDELAAAMGEVLGRTVRARSTPREQWTATLEGQGMPPGFIVPFSEMEDGFNSGWIAFGVPGTEPVPASVTPAQFFRKIRAN